jgi:hypothetical protein
MRTFLHSIINQHLKPNCNILYKITCPKEEISKELVVLKVLLRKYRYYETIYLIYFQLLVMINCCLEILLKKSKRFMLILKKDRAANLKYHMLSLRYIQTNSNVRSSPTVVSLGLITNHSLISQEKCKILIFNQGVSTASVGPRLSIMQLKCNTCIVFQALN